MGRCIAGARGAVLTALRVLLTELSVRTVHRWSQVGMPMLRVELNF